MIVVIIRSSRRRERRICRLIIISVEARSSLKIGASVEARPSGKAGTTGQRRFLHLWLGARSSGEVSVTSTRCKMCGSGSEVMRRKISN